jgi:hypothetical protein
MNEIGIAAQVLVFLVVLSVFLASGQASVFHPLGWYLAFHGIVFVLRPILVLFLGFDAQLTYMGFEPTPEECLRALAASSVGLCAFAGACLFTGRSDLTFGKSASIEFSQAERRSLLITTLLMLPIIGFSIFATRNGIAGENRGGVYINTNSVGYLNDAQFAIMPLICAWMVVTRFHWLNLVPTVFYIGYRTWFGWSRWTILLFALLVGAAYCWHRRKLSIPLWVMVAGVPFFLLFNLLGHNRDMLKAFFEGSGIRAVQFDPGMTAAVRWRKKYDGPDFGNFDYLAFITAVVPERTGTYTYGSQYLQLFTEPIPRKLWKGKPVGAPVALFNLNAYGNFNGLTYSLCGDGWMSGGWIGLIATMLIAGALLGRAHRWFWRHLESGIAGLFYLSALAMLPQWYRDGSISIAKFMLWNWLPLVIWTGLSWTMGTRLVPNYSLLMPARRSIHLFPFRSSAPAQTTGAIENSPG